MAATGTSSTVAAALVGSTEVEGVRPDGDAAEGGGDGGVVNEELIGHHFVLFVATDAEGRSTDTDDGAVGDVGETLDDDTVTGHLGQPVVVGAFAPVGLVLVVTDGEGGDLVTATVEVLHGRVVGVSVRHEEGSFNLAAVGILTNSAEDFFVESDVVAVDGSAEGQCDHLRNVAGFQSTGNAGTVRRAEAIGQNTLRSVAFWGAVGIGFDGASVFIGSVRAVDVVVAEEFLFDTFAITAGKMFFRADGLLGLEKGKRFAWFFKTVAV